MKKIFLNFVFRSISFRIIILSLIITILSILVKRDFNTDCGIFGCLFGNSRNFYAYGYPGFFIKTFTDKNGGFEFNLLPFLVNVILWSIIPLSILRICLAVQTINKAVKNRKPYLKEIIITVPFIFLSYVASLIWIAIILNR